MPSVSADTKVGVVGVYNTADLYRYCSGQPHRQHHVLNNTTAGLTGLSFEATSPNPSKQIIGNGMSNSNADPDDHRQLDLWRASGERRVRIHSSRQQRHQPWRPTRRRALRLIPPPAAARSPSAATIPTPARPPCWAPIPACVLNYIGTASSGNMVLSGANAALTLNNPNNLNYTGVISGATGSFTKGSGGTLTLSKANTYGGATTISGGTLSLDFSATGAPASNILYNSGSPSFAHPERRGAGPQGKSDGRQQPAVQRSDAGRRRQLNRAHFQCHAAAAVGQRRGHYAKRRHPVGDQSLGHAQRYQWCANDDRHRRRSVRAATAFLTWW